MSARKADTESSVPHPRETSVLSGHREAETALLNAYKSGRIPHAWLIGGGQGIGKATLAYRMARFVLTHRDPLSATVQRADTLAVDPGGGGGAACRILLAWRPADPGAHAQRQGRDAHGDRGRSDPRDHLVLRFDRGGRGLAGLHRRHRRRAQSERGERAVEGARGAAAAIAVPSDEYAPARLLPTILSRCRKLMLRPLATEDVIRAASQAAGLAADDPALAEAAAASEGSVARALTLLGGDTLKLQSAPQRCGGACRASTRVSYMHWAMRSAPATGWRCRPLSTVSTAGWRNGCAGPMPMRTCPALHGWRRYGKRSPAPRATPRITIWNENRWFSRCSRCLRTRRGRA